VGVEEKYLQEYTQKIEASLSGQVNFQILYQSIENFRNTALSVAVERRKTDDILSTPMQKRALNDRLFLTERAFIKENGIMGRQFNKHVIFATENYNTYAEQDFPGLCDAIFNKDYIAADFQVRFISQVIDGAAQVLSGSI